MKRPDLKPSTLEVEVGYVNRLLGLNLSSEQVKDYLERMRYGVECRQDMLSVSVPSYRSDILHPIDVVEDVAIAYGYMNFKPEIPKLATHGRALKLELYLEDVRDVMVGLGFREVMTLVLTNPANHFERMCLEPEEVVSAVKPVSSEQSIARTWAISSLMVVLEKNRSREYPQRIFEVADVVYPDGSDAKKLAGVIAHSKTNFSEVKSVVSGLMKEVGLEAEDEIYQHPSFIEGRCVRNSYGFYGEISPLVLSNFGLEVPVTAFEYKLA